MADIRFSSNTNTWGNYEVPAALEDAAQFAKTVNQLALEAINYYASTDFTPDSVFRIFATETTPSVPSDGDLWWNNTTIRRYVAGYGNSTRTNLFADQRHLDPALPDFLVTGGIKEPDDTYTLRDRPTVRFTCTDPAAFSAGLVVKAPSAGVYTVSFDLVSTQRSAWRAFNVTLAGTTTAVVLDAPDTPARVSVQATLAAGNNSLAITHGEGEEPMAGDICYVGAVLVEAGIVSGEFFDGASLGTQWSGTPGNSTSVYAPGWMTDTTGFWPQIQAVISPSDYTDGYVDVYSGIEPMLPGTGDLWDDNTGSLYKWDGAAWFALVDSGDPAVIAYINQQAQSIASAVETIAGIEGQLDGIVNIFYQATAPDPLSVGVGDIWIDTTNGKLMKRWDGDSWEIITDERVQEALDGVGGKITSYFSVAAPVAPAGGFVAGDLWFETDQNNRLRRWDGDSWEDASDSRVPVIQAALDQLATDVGDVQSDLVGLNGQLDGKSRVFYQNTAPTEPGGGALGADDQGDIWIDTSTTPSTFKSWTGSAWVVITDPKATEALAKVGGKITTYYGATAPTAPVGGFTTGDLWFDTDDNNKLYRWNGSWVDIADGRITSALGQIGNLQTSLTGLEGLVDGKAQIYYQSTAPTGMTISNKGDVWIDTSTTPSTFKSYDGAAWQIITDPVAAQALSTVSGKITSYYQAGMPSGGTYVNGDLWFDTDDNNRIYRYNSTTTAWEDISDDRVDVHGTEIGTIKSDIITIDDTLVTVQQGIGTLETGVGNLQVAVSSRGRSFMSDQPPPGVNGSTAPAVTPKADDIWRQFTYNITGDPLTVIGEWFWNGSSWITTRFGDSVLSGLDVGKLVASSAIIGTAVVNKLVGALAEFITVKAQNIQAGTLNVALNMGVGGQLQLGATNQVHIVQTGNQITVYMPGEQNPDGSFEPRRAMYTFGGPDGGAFIAFDTSTSGPNAGSELGGVRADGSLFGPIIDAGQIRLAGDDITSTISRRTQVIAQGGIVSTHSNYSGETSVIGFKLPEMKAGYYYKISVTFRGRCDTATAYATVNLRYAVNGASVSLSSPTLDAQYFDNGQYPTLLRTRNFAWYYAPTSDTDRNRFLLTIGASTGTATSRDYRIEILEIPFSEIAESALVYDAYTAPPLSNFTAAYVTSDHFTYSQAGKNTSYSPSLIRSGTGGTSYYRTYVIPSTNFKNRITGASSISKVLLRMTAAKDNYDVTPQIGTTSTTSFSSLSSDSSVTISNAQTSFVDENGRGPVDWRPGETHWVQLSSGIIAALKSGHSLVVGRKTSAPLISFYSETADNDKRPQMKMYGKE